MDSYERLFVEQPVPYQSIDGMMYSNGCYSTLPPIPETEWEFEQPWVPGQNAQFYDPSIQPSEGTREQEREGMSQLLNELSDLGGQLKQLQQTVSENQETLCKKIDDMGKSMGKSVAATQRYVDSLVPWSMEVHENINKLKEAVSETLPGKVAATSADKNLLKGNGSVA